MGQHMHRQSFQSSQIGAERCALRSHSTAKSMKHLIFAALATAAVGFAVPASASTSILRPELATAARTAAPQLQKASPAPTVVAQEKKENGSAESSSEEKENGAAKTEEQKEENK